MLHELAFLAAARSPVTVSIFPSPVRRANGFPPFAHAIAQGVTVDAEGNVYGADFLGMIRKFVKK
jgi:hypothetical protein